MLRIREQLERGALGLGVGLTVGLAACTGTNDAISADGTCKGAGCAADVGTGGAGGEPGTGGDPNGGSGGAGGESGTGGDPNGGAGGAGGEPGTGGDPVGGAGGGGGEPGTGGEPAGGAGGAGGEPGPVGGEVGGSGGMPSPIDAPPRAVAEAPATVRPGARVRLEGGRSFDPEGEPLAYAWRQLDGAPVQLDDAGTPQAAFDAPAGRGAVAFTLTVTDAAGQSDTATVSVQIGNTPPVADAGVDQAGVAPGASVSLDGSATRDPDGDAVTFLWRQVAGPEVLLDDPLAPAPRFTAPEARAHLVFELVVSDGLATVTDTVAVDVDNRPPVAEAGADRLIAPRGRGPARGVGDGSRWRAHHPGVAASRGPAGRARRPLPTRCRVPGARAADRAGLRAHGDGWHRYVRPGPGHAPRRRRPRRRPMRGPTCSTSSPGPP
jgi:hypothetical protein